MSNHHLGDNSTYVYRLFDTEGRLIYVGATAKLGKRLDTHSKSIWWGPQIDVVKTVLYPNRDAAAAAEREAVQTEHPRWNVNLRKWSRGGWSRQNLLDFITALENIHGCKSKYRVGRIALAKQMLAEHDEELVAA